MFVWGAASHMVLPIGTMGWKSLPAEETLVPQLKQAISERGLYSYPGMGEGEMSKEEQKALEEKVRRGPQVMLLFNPAGSELITGRQLGTELLSNVLAALFAAVILARVPAGRFSRTMLATAMGVLSWLSIEVSYWNWYGFPTEYAEGAFIDQTVGWLLTGGTVAMILGRKRPAALSQA